MAIQLFIKMVAANGLVLGFVPESMALLMFGLGLIGLTVGIRWWFDRTDEFSVKVREKR